MSWISPAAMADEETAPKTIFAIDFDGTIVENSYPGIGAPIPMAIEVLQDLLKKKYRLILNTMRSGKELNEAVVYCNRNNIDFWGINENPDQKAWTDSPKVYANVIIDDTAAGTPLIMGANQKACVDWKKMRELLVSWEVLDPKDDEEPGVQTFDLK